VGETPTRSTGEVIKQIIAIKCRLSLSTSHSFQFEFYCKETYEIRLDPFHGVSTQQLRSVASSITEYIDEPSFEAMDVDNHLYVYGIRLDSGDVPQFLALNPRTCVYYVAEAYPIDDQQILEKRLELVEKIPVSFNDFTHILVLS